MELTELNSFVKDAITGIGVMHGVDSEEGIPKVSVYYTPLQIQLLVPYTPKEDLFLTNVLEVLKIEVFKLKTYHELAANTLDELLFELED
jgi:hypothetical protein